MKGNGYVGALIRLVSCALWRKSDRQRFRQACQMAFRNVCLQDNLIRRMQEMQLSTARMHTAAFAEFKGAYQGRDVVVVATGPSLERFRPIENAAYIGVNKAYRTKGLSFDFLFAQDYTGLKDCMPEMNAYRRGSCVKFYGLSREEEQLFNLVIPESDVMAADARRYRTIWWPVEDDVVFKERFAYDLTTGVLASFESVVFPALQFALWTQPKRIFLVGCDCSGAAHASVNGNSDTGRDFSDLQKPYVRFGAFAKRFYPETEIISVNPVGLKGIFKDLIQ